MGDTEGVHNLLEYVALLIETVLQVSLVVADYRCFPSSFLYPIRSLLGEAFSPDINKSLSTHSLPFVAFHPSPPPFRIQICSFTLPPANPNF